MLNAVTCIYFKESFISPGKQVVFAIEMQGCFGGNELFYMYFLHGFLPLCPSVLLLCSCYPVNIKKHPLGLDQKMGGKKKIMLHLIPSLLRNIPSSWHRLLLALYSPGSSALIALRLIRSEIKERKVPKGLHSINRKGAGFIRAQQKLWLQQTADCISCTIAISMCNTSPFPATLKGGLERQMAFLCSSWLCQDGESWRSPCLFTGMLRRRMGALPPTPLFFFSFFQSCRLETLCQPLTNVLDNLNF